MCWLPSAFFAAWLLLAATASAHGGILVDSVIPESPAAEAGLEAGDRLVRLDGREIAAHQDLEKVMAAHQPGDTVPLTVERRGETVDLELTFGKRPGGGVSIGVRLAVGMDPGGDATTGSSPDSDAATAECLAWIEETYRIESLTRDLDLELSADRETTRACVVRDTRRIGPERAVKFCDNIFKVHCSGVDLLAEIGEALVDRCEERLGESSGLDPRKEEAWKTCARHRVFDRYAVDGEASDEAACKAAWDQCSAPDGDGEPSAWQQWGGPNRDFKAPAAGLAASWPANGPEKLWTRALGDGYSAILAEGTRLYTMYRDGNEEAVVCLDAESGETVWEHRYENQPHKKHVRQFGDGPSSTPLIAGDLLFTISVAGKMNALRKKDGGVVWSRNLWDQDLGGDFLAHGYSSSPVAYGSTVIVPVGGGAGLVAFDQEDGGVEWKSPAFRNSYSSPIVASVAGEDQLLVFMAEELIGIDPATGELRWRYPHANQWQHNISLPAVDGDMIFLSSPQAGSRGLRLVRDGETISVEEIWSTRRVQFYHASTVRIGDWVYGSSGTGLAFMTAVNVRTGEIGWRERGFAKANCVEADGKLVILDEDGVLYLAEATPEKLVVLAETRLLDRRAWTVPTIVGSTLYVRDRRRIMAVDLG